MITRTDSTPARAVLAAVRREPGLTVWEIADRIHTARIDAVAGMVHALHMEGLLGWEAHPSGLGRLWYAA